MSINSNIYNTINFMNLCSLKNSIPKNDFEAQKFIDGQIRLSLNKKCEEIKNESNKIHK